MKSHVYLMRCEGFLKIGVAGSIRLRQTGIQTCNPFEVKLVAYRQFATVPLANAAEAHLHEQFRDKRHRREWFAISDDEAIEALRAISVDELTKPETVTIEWFPYKGAPGYSEEVPKESVVPAGRSRHR